MDRYSIYWIHLKSEGDIFLQGYVGKAKNVARRWKRHKAHSVLNSTKKNSRPLYVAFREHGLESFIFELVANDLDQRSAYNLEFALRPCFGVGYNMAAGGTYSSAIECSSLSPLRHTESGKKRMKQYRNAVLKHYQSKDA